MQKWFCGRLVLFGCLLFAYPVRALAQSEVRTPPRVGVVKERSVYSAELREQVREDRNGSFDVFLFITQLYADGPKRPVQEYHISYLGTRDRFLPWRIAYGSIWINEGQTFGGFDGHRGMRMPEEDLRIYAPADYDNWEKRNNLLRMRYGKYWGIAHRWDLAAPVDDAARRAGKPEFGLGTPFAPGACCFDVLPRSERQYLCVTLAAGRLTVFRGEGKGPSEAPTSAIDWAQIGKDANAGFQELFVLFTCAKDLALVTESGKVYRIKPPVGDEAVVVEPIWVSVPRPIEMVVTDADRGITYAFAAPATGSARSIYFALSEQGRQTTYEVPEQHDGLRQIELYARILLKDGKLNPP